MRLSVWVRVTQCATDLSCPLEIVSSHTHFQLTTPCPVHVSRSRIVQTLSSRRCRWLDTTLKMFASFRDSLTPTRSRPPPLAKIRASAQSFFVPDRHANPELHDAEEKELQDHPLTPGPTFLSRNKTERKRLQGLVMTRTVSVYDENDELVKNRTMVEKVKVWMVNDGELNMPRLGAVRDGQADQSVRNGQTYPGSLGTTTCRRIRPLDRTLSDEGQPHRRAHRIRLDFW